MVLDSIPYPHFDPNIVKFGFVAIRWYALAYIVGILLGWWYVMRLARRADLWGARPMSLNRDQIDDLVLFVTLGVILGGRLGSVLFYNTAMIWEEPLRILYIWEGGMSFHGGMIGVALMLLLFTRMKKIPLLTISDLVAPCVPFGLFFGRIANFVNDELWGRETSVPWGFSGTRQGEDIVVHPSQLYEAALEGVLLFIVLRLATHRFGQLKKPGAVTGLFLAGYGVLRMLVETVRAPDRGLDNWPLGLTMGMVLSFLMFVPGVWLLWRSRQAQPEATVPAPAAAPKAAPAPAPAKAPAKPAAKPAAPKAKPAASKPAAKPAAKPRPKAPPKPKK